MDVLDENEDNPLFFKNLEMRVKVEAINAATHKALPSMDEMVLEEDEHDSCLTREQIIAKYLKNNKNAIIMHDWPVEAPGDEAHVDALKEPEKGSLRNLEKCERDKPNEEEQSQDIFDEDKENRALQSSYSMRRAEADCPHASRKVSNLVGEGDCIAAQGDGCQCGPSKEELLMAKLIKCVSIDCGEYFNPVTGETILLEEGDTKIKPQNAHFRLPSRNLKKNSLKLNNLIGQNQNLPAYVDIRTKTNCPEIQNRGKEKDDGKRIANKDKSKIRSDTENLGDCSSIADDEVVLAKQSSSVFDTDDKDASFLWVKDSLDEVGDIAPSIIPRACVLDDKMHESSSCCIETLGESLSTNLTGTIFKVQSAETSSSKESLDKYLDRQEEYSVSAPCSAEINDTVDSAWDWVTAIPRAYYAEDDYLVNCVSGMSVYLENALDCRLLKETFKLRTPSSFSVTKNHQQWKNSKKVRDLEGASAPNVTVDINSNNEKTWPHTEDPVLKATEMMAM